MCVSFAIIQNIGVVDLALISLGSSTMVLCLFPLWLGILITGVPFLWGYWTGEVAFDSSMLERWGEVLLISFLCSSFTKSFFGGADLVW